MLTGPGGHGKFRHAQNPTAFFRIKELTVDIEQNGTYSDKELWFRKSWRIAVETWLKKNRFITVSTPEEVLPISA
jgi:hypothetical protein